MGNLTMTLKNKNTNIKTNFIFNNGVYKLIPGSKNYFIENQIDKINFVPVENIFQLMIGSNDGIQSVDQKQDIYSNYLNLTDYNFLNYSVNISTDDNTCLFDSEKLNLNIHALEIADTYGFNNEDTPFKFVIVLYSINNIKENNNG